MNAPPALRTSSEPPTGADVVVIGAGIVGTAVAARASRAGAEVCLVERAGPAAGSSSSGEGNVLVSDKLPGPEFDLAMRSLTLWRALEPEAVGRLELERKGGLVVAHDAAELKALYALADRQAACGVRAQRLEGDDLADMEPELTRTVAGGVFYEDDLQVQPMHAVAYQLEQAVASGCRMVRDTEVLGWGGLSTSRAYEASDARGSAQGGSELATTRGRLRVGIAVVNAAGPWAGEVARRLGSDLPVMPRRGHVLVTEPVTTVTPHKVYEADYVGSIHDDGGGWRCSSVVEATASATMLLGSSREFVGWDASPDPAVVAAIAGRAVALFPVLERVRLLRAYVGFRPATPDRLPAIGWDARVPGLLHATGHEGGGIGLSQATAEAVQCILCGTEPPVALEPFDPARFDPARFEGATPPPGGPPS